ncbi:MAG: GNAT family N-acetyltransferase [Paracoccaceae bacterium]|nr:GNAT family N-acetyltransferase [Paracoccaceae bacterium]
MTAAIRPLCPGADRAAVADLFRRSADYVRLERDEEPDDALADEFFADAVPGGRPQAQVKLGLFDAEGRLLGLADMGLGYPEPAGAFLGLLQLAAEARGQGLGRAFLRHLAAEARARGARRLFIAVLHANPRGRAFWEREGFAVETETRMVTLGTKTQPANRMVKPL